MRCYCARTRRCNCRIGRRSITWRVRDRGRGGVDARVARGVWKTSEPLFDLDQWLNIAKHGPNVNVKQVVGVCNAQQRLVHPLPHGLHTRCPRRDARRGSSWP